MEQQVIQLIDQRIADYFETVKAILLDNNSYKEKVNPKNLHFYFQFLESALQRPYNRLASITAFTANYDGLLSSQMYPLALLKEEARKCIYEKYQQAVNFAAGLDLSGIDPGFITLCKETHTKDLDIKIRQEDLN